MCSLFHNNHSRCFRNSLSIHPLLRSMISISKSQVPSYLRNSEFYHALDEDGGEITIPRDCFKESTVIVSTQDLRRLLSICRI